jgi:hypothetical protein
LKAARASHSSRKLPAYVLLLLLPLRVLPHFCCVSLQYGESGAPDVWFEPTQVWEVKAADLSISPLHQAGLGLVEPGKGISIR